mgnify:CR=1 FL=1
MADHDLHHYHTPVLTKQERELWGYTRNSVNSCTDANIAYQRCLREEVSKRSAVPFGFVWVGHWADRWYCADELGGVNSCEHQRMVDYFAKHKEIIKAINQEG